MRMKLGISSAASGNAPPDAPRSRRHPAARPCRWRSRCPAPGWMYLRGFAELGTKPGPPPRGWPGDPTVAPWRELWKARQPTETSAPPPTAAPAPPPSWPRPCPPPSRPAASRLALLPRAPLIRPGLSWEQIRTPGRGVERPGSRLAAGAGARGPGGGPERSVGTSRGSLLRCSLRSPGPRRISRAETEIARQGRVCEMGELQGVAPNAERRSPLSVGVVLTNPMAALSCLKYLFLGAYTQAAWERPVWLPN